MSSAVLPFLPPGPPLEPLVRFSVEQYHTMIQAGVFAENERIELLEGWLVEKMTKNPPHTVATGLLIDVIAEMLPKGWHLISQESITTEDSEPEPDLAVVRGKRRDYLNHHPQPHDLALVVEVADTSLVRDRGVKKTIYARAGISHYWIVNLIDRCVESFSAPTGKVIKPDFQDKHTFGPAECIPFIASCAANESFSKSGHLNVHE